MQLLQIHELYAKCCLVHCIEENNVLVLVPFFTLTGPQVSILVPVQAGLPNSLIRRSRSTILIRVSQIPKHPVWVSSKEFETQVKRHFEHDMN